MPKRTAKVAELWRRLDALPAGSGPSARGALDAVFTDVEWPVELAPRRVMLSAHGDPDDHLRLVALAAEQAQQIDRAIDPEVIQHCMSPTTPWCTRAGGGGGATKRGAFEHLLGELRRRNISLYVEDLDALEPYPDAAEEDEDAHRWDDRDFTGPRREVQGLLVDAVTRAVEQGLDWALLRTTPNMATTRRLEHLRHRDFESTDELSPALEAQLPPSVRPLAQRLERGAVEEVRSRPGVALETSVVDTAWGVLPPTTQSAALRLSALRGYHSLNGHAGFFGLTTSPRPFPCLARSDIEHLARTGWILAAGDRFTMHRPIRAWLRQRAMDELPSLVQDDHRAFGALDRDPLGQRLEIHYHAVRGGSEEDALSSAVCYGADLRLLAIELSKTRQPEAVRRSADIWKSVVERFDEYDAYAWEYLGFNLELIEGHQPDQVRLAYEKACELDPTNPLYRGRLLGYRGRCGDEIADEFDERLRAWLQGRDRGAVRYFVEAVLNSLERGGASAVAAQRRTHILDRWRTVIQSDDRLGRLLRAGDRGERE
ncbi:MAG: hypothetical protein H6704_27840 [Myxococcales bacterium]|nr:hypothetical protein [Myxococcales bacterium]